MLPTKFGVNMPFCLQEKRKTDFYDGSHGGHLGFPIRMILVISIYSSPKRLYQVYKQLAFCFRWSEKMIFKMATTVAILDFPSEKFNFLFHLQVTPMLPTKLHVNGPFVSGGEAENKLSRLWPWRPSYIFDRNNFSYFLSISHPDAFKSIRLSVQEKQNIDF